MTRPSTSALALLTGALLAMQTGALSAADSPETIAGVLKTLRVEEAPAPVRERKDWRRPKKIVLLAFNPGTAGERDQLASAVPGVSLVAAKNPTEAVAAARDADVLIGFNPEICSRELIDGARQLRWIQSLAAGVENCMAIRSLHDRNLLVTNMRGVDSAAIAEHAIALALALAHGLDVYASDTSRAVWSRQHAAITPMRVLAGKTMLVVGLGGIGTEVASKAHGLGMNVIATRASGEGKPDFVSQVGTPDDLMRFAREADVIVSAVPLTAQTTGMYDAKFFAVVKPTALFINVARGASVVTADLAAALSAGRLAGAGLDVVDPEPLPADSPLWRVPHLIVSPHTSGRSDLPGDARWVIARENLRRYVAGDRMLSVVDISRGY
jgi:phosphoglycerate dehydrogenase-like enzyme